MPVKKSIWFQFRILLFMYTGILNVYAIKTEKEKLDSMSALVYQLPDDTNKVNTLIRLSFGLSDYNQQQAVLFGKQANELAEKLNYNKGKGEALNSLGINYFYHSENQNALDCFLKALQINEKLGLQKQIARNLGNIGLVYENLAQYPLALEFLFKSLSLFEKINDPNGIANQLANIGNIYQETQAPLKALHYDSLAMLIYRKLQLKDGEANTYGNISNIYSDLGESDQAISFAQLALKLFSELGNKVGEARNLNNLAVLYEERLEYAKSIDFHFKSMAIYNELESMQGLQLSKMNLGELFLKYADSSQIIIRSQHIPNNQTACLNLSLKFLSDAIKIGEQTGELNNLSYSYMKYSWALEKKGDFKSSLMSLRKHKELEDSIFTLENKAQIEKLTTQRELDLKNKQIEIDKLAVEKKKDRETFLLFGIGILTMLLGLIFRNFRRQKLLNNALTLEKNKSDELLLNILPYEVAEELKTKGSADARQIDEVTVLFTDFKGFTRLSETMTPKELVSEINECFSVFDHIMLKHGIEKIKTIGDSYMAAGGLPTANQTHAKDVVKAALEIQQFMFDRNAKKQSSGQSLFEIRIGVHSGPVVAGIVGVKKFAYDIWGDTVNTASRMESSGEVGKVNLSGTTYELVKNEFTCIYRGKIDAKGKGEIDMYFLETKKFD